MREEKSPELVGEGTYADQVRRNMAPPPPIHGMGWDGRSDREATGGESQCGFGFDGTASRRQTGGDTIHGG
jgi:hypothetical protein